LKSCKFAIRSGGHTPYVGASNIENGVTLDLHYLSTVEYDAKKALVKVGPAATWNDVYDTLEPLNAMTSGGRSSTVGVGGLTLGGGISYFSPGRGLVCDNVIEFEVVLADGRIVTASKTSHPDLFAVLTGKEDPQLSGPVRTAKAAMKRIEPSVNDMTNFLGLRATEY
jgi:FAD/FMN-containing dehydrogenase